MSAESTLGTAHAEIVIDLTRMTGDITRAKTLVSSLGPSFEQTYVKMDGAQKRATVQAIKLTDQIGKTREEIRLQGLEAKGAAPEALDHYRKALERQTQEMQKAGLSTRAYAAAMRGVPAQITDIVVSLQGGQRPLTVLMQQGGQLKDMFGGVVPAAKALGASIVGLINPFTLAAAGGLAFVGAAYKGAEQSEALRKALIVTGNSAGYTASQLQDSAHALGLLSGSTTGSAIEALTQAAQSGQLTGNQMLYAAQGAVQWSEATGVAIKDTLAHYDELAHDPVKALLKLNESMHFLTVSVYDQVKGLQEHGQSMQASDVAMRAYTETLDTRSKEATANLGYLEKAWNSVKHTSKQAWDAMLDVGRDETLGDKIREKTTYITELKARLKDTVHAGDRAQITAGITTQTAELEKLKAQSRAESEQAKRRFERSDLDAYLINTQAKIDESRPDKEKLVLELQKIRGESNRHLMQATKLGDEGASARIKRQTEELIAAAKEKYKDNKDNSADSVRSAALQGYKDTLEKEKAQIAASTKLTEAQFHAKEITAKPYYSQLEDLNQKEDKAEEAAIRNQILYLQMQKLSGKDAIEVRKQIGMLEAELAKKRMEHAAQSVSLQTQNTAYLTEQQRQIKDYSDRLKESTDTLRDEMHTMVDRISLGEREYELQKKLNDIQKERDKTLFRLKEQHDAKQIDDAVFEQNKAAVSQDATTKQNVVQEGFRQRALAEQSGENGLTSGWADYVTTAKNSAEQVRGALTDAFSSAEDAFVKFTQTGKLSFKDLANSVVADLARMSAKQLITGGVSALSGVKGLSGLAGLLGASGAGAASTVAGGAASLAAANGAAAGNALTALTGGLVPNAHGGVYAAPGLHAYANTVVSKPTIFPFARGVGLMGEAGPEAIVPLKRLANNELGIQVAGGKPPVTRPTVHQPTTINNTVVIKERTDRQTVEQINRHQGRATFRALARTGR